MRPLFLKRHGDGSREIETDLRLVSFLESLWSLDPSASFAWKEKQILYSLWTSLTRKIVLAYLVVNVASFYWILVCAKCFGLLIDCNRNLWCYFDVTCKLIKNNEVLVFVTLPISFPCVVRAWEMHSLFRDDFLSCILAVTWYSMYHDECRIYSK